MVKFNVDRCKGCSLCVSACPKKIVALSVTKLNARGFHPAEILDETACISCGFCALMCPDCVITVHKEEKAGASNG